MSDFTVKDYQKFDDTELLIDNLNSKLTDNLDSINDNKKKLSNGEIFMGPIADDCANIFEKVDTSITNLMANFTTIKDYLAEVSLCYQSGDAKSAKILLMGADGMLTISSIPTYADEKDVPKITVDQVKQCGSIQEYLDLVMPIYTFYCQKYGIKYPGALALQPVHEHSAPQGIKAQSAVQDNNLGGLKYSSSIPNATPGSYPSDGTGGRYSHFNNVTEYIEAHCWNIAHEGSYYQAAMAKDNMKDFTLSMVRTWVGHDGNYGSKIVDEYSKYGLDQYELNI